MRTLLYFVGLVVLVLGCSGERSESPRLDSHQAAGAAPAPRINPAIWPQQSPPLPQDPALEQQIAALLARMTLEEKVGQVIQADIASVTPAEVREYHLGSILNGGNSAPGGDNRAPASAWLALADEFWQASTDTGDGGAGIPTLWGTDAVHGHNNIVGATIFPHNIGLGAANDPDLMYAIGRATVTEMLVTGLDWTFAPTIAVVRDDRWGRTYESYSEDPAIVKAYAGRLVEGIQGAIGSDDFLGDTQLIATAKHFIGDGGTVDGRDQGDNRSSEAALRDVQGAGYPVAIRHGVQVVMASFNSWHGRKLHGHKALLTDVLVQQMGFDGFVVGDWNGHGQVAGCSNVSCAAAFNNGIDMFMAPDSWRGLFANTLAQVREGTISEQRLDQAVSRILRVKFRAGLFDAGLPSKRQYAGRYELLGAPAHRQLARRAVRQSLVLLKNEGQLLPVSPTARILVAGDGADNIGKQSGGWTLSWQGTGNSNAHFPNGTSIYAGIRRQVSAAGGTAVLSEEGDYSIKPDVAVVVFGEDPYAEYQGDRAHLDLPGQTGLALLQKFKAAGIPTVAVLLSGRALWVNPEINAADAFVAAWLPGTEGGGVADVLLRGPDGGIQHDFTGKLSFSWPRSASQTAVNIGDADYNPLFAYGGGLTYSDRVSLGTLSEDPQLAVRAGLADSFLSTGDPVAPWRLVIRDTGGTVQVTTGKALSPTGALAATAVDHKTQEDTSLFVWRGRAQLSIEGEPIDLSGQAADGVALEIGYQVIGAGVSQTRLSLGCGPDCAGGVNITEQLAGKLNRGWQLAHLKLSCFARAGTDMASVNVPLEVQAAGPLSLQLSHVKLVPGQADAGCTL
ncbi:glycoside hydrolase family 3 protein [Exilibacterium tricleocarpae]|uniref:Glycoside hydrolase family 3 protein n=1 Tax=Exilibacterium tricleocarpae TaxID=2591008 RepID=A0A545TVI1_9GAMM|nr:exo 1,3/1,4-beta-D-glucan glucohydrolase [Exilibacterium tricleocarpae]TQV81228.1 glycoside hydrolase family 3 protein [Exilibacterium tricleocarpae]